MVVGMLQSHGAPDSPVRHRTLSGAPATSEDRWGSTVGALSCGPARLSGGAPDKSCRLSGVPHTRALSSARAGAHLMRRSRPLRAKYVCDATNIASITTTRNIISNFPFRLYKEYKILYNRMYC